MLQGSRRAVRDLSAWSVVDREEEQAANSGPRWYARRTVRGTQTS